MKLNQSDIIRDEQFIAGIGYQDGYFRDTTTPKELWELWDHDQRMLYTNACMQGSHARFQRDSTKLVNTYIALWRSMCLQHS